MGWGSERDGRPGRIILRAMTARSLALLAVVLSSLAGAPARAAERGEGAFEFTLAAGAMEEVCFRLAAHEVTRWSFVADAPVDFNLHWHEGKTVHMPVRRDAARDDAGRYAAPQADDYCLMWTALAAPARVSGRVERER
jgi:hypothetical protein